MDLVVASVVIWTTDMYGFEPSFSGSSVCQTSVLKAAVLVLS